MIKLLMGTHAEIREFLIHYVENELPLLKACQFKLHLLMCKDCAEYLKRYDSSLKLAQNYLNDPPPEELVNLTLKFLEENRPEQEAEGDPCTC